MKSLLQVDFVWPNQPYRHIFLKGKPCVFRREPLWASSWTDRKGHTHKPCLLEAQLWTIFYVLLISFDVQCSSILVCRMCFKFSSRFLYGSFSKLLLGSAKWKSFTAAEVVFGSGGWKLARTAAECWVLRNPDLDLFPQSWCRKPYLECVCKPTL